MQIGLAAVAVALAAAALLRSLQGHRPACSAADSRPGTPLPLDEADPLVGGHGDHGDDDDSVQDRRAVGGPGED